MTSITRLLPDVTLPPNSTEPLVALAMSAWLLTLGGGVFLPVLPEMIEALRLDPEQAGVLAAAFPLTAALCTPVFGALCDRFGHGRLLLISLVCYGAVGVAPAFLSGYESILASRLLLGVAKAGLTAAVLAILVSLLKGMTRTNVLGYATGFMTLSSIGTYLIAGFLGAGQWHHAFFVFLLCLPVAGFVAWVMRKTTVFDMGQAKQRADLHRSLVSTLGQSGIVVVLIAIATVSAAAQVMRVFGPIQLNTAFGIGPDTSGVMLALMALGAVILSALISGRAARALGPYPTIALGLAAMTLSLMAILVTPSLILNGLSFFVLGAGFGLAMPTLFDALATRCEGNRQASVMAVGSSLNAIGLFSAPLLMGYVWTHISLSGVFLLSGLLTALSAMAVLWAHGRIKGSETG